MSEGSPSNSSKELHFWKQIEESLWKCSFCGDTTTINPFDYIDENWREKLKPGWRVYNDPSPDPKNPLMNYKGDSELAIGFIYAPYPPNGDK